jgi:hypothetical protein
MGCLCIGSWYKGIQRVQPQTIRGLCLLLIKLLFLNHSVVRPQSQFLSLHTQVHLLYIMDPNASTEVPAGFTPVTLSKTTTFIVKFGVFGTFAVVVSSAIGFGLYLVFFKKKHRERQATRREEVVRSALSSTSILMPNDFLLQARDMEKGILPRSRHYPIGKVPRIRNKAPPLRPPEPSPGIIHANNPDLSRSSTRSSKHSSSSRSPRRPCRVSRAPDPISDIPELPETFTSRKTTSFS